MKTLNEVYSNTSTQRRYEVWFLRLGLADGSGSWWFRYLLMNPGRKGCISDPKALPVQVWATWFPHAGKPHSFIKSFSLDNLEMSAKGRSPFHFRCGSNEIGEGFCRGELEVEGHSISWDLRWSSTFRVTLSNKGWIGFSRTPHSDAVFSGRIRLDDRSFEAETLGFGVQGHNCGYRHRNFWTWTHAYFPRAIGSGSTLEALVYEMPFGLVFRKAVLWHEGKAHEFKHLRETERNADTLQWIFRCATSQHDEYRLEVNIDGTGPSVHRLPYVKTDCSGTFEVTNNSLARAEVRLERQGRLVDTLETRNGAVLEMVGRS